MSWLRERLERTVSPRALGVLRITIGMTAVLKALELAPVLVRFDDAATLRIPYLEGFAIVDVGSAPLLTAWIVTAVLFALGARTTVAGSALSFILAGVLVADQQLYSNHLYLLLLLVALVTIGRAGSAMSVDAWRGRGSEVVPGWPLDLLRVQVSIVYGFAALAKLNAVYLSGSVVAAYLRRDGPLAIPGEWRTFEVMAIFSVLSIMTEAFLAIALWLPRWRAAAFVAGLGLHLSIAILLDPPVQLLIFGLMILPVYLLFLDSRPHSRALIWDDSCGFCGRTIEWLRRLDWLHVVDPIPSSNTAAREALGVSQAEADQAIQLVTLSSGRHTSGFAAVQRVLQVLPVSFLWAPLLRLPPIMALGDRAYRRIAARRSCNIALRPPGAANAPV
ncbi:MAG: HTTM domain-containing protein [Candidatus Limnocylindria bacterium]